MIAGTVTGTATNAGSAAFTRPFENRDSVTLYAGQAVRLHPSGAGAIAWDGLAECLGLFALDVAPSAAGPVQVAGFLTLEDWTAVTGAAALQPGRRYYAQVGGQLTVQPPSAGIVQAAGLAISTTTLELLPPFPILL